MRGTIYKSCRYVLDGATIDREHTDHTTFGSHIVQAHGQHDVIKKKTMCIHICKGPTAAQE